MIRCAGNDALPFTFIFSFRWVAMISLMIIHHNITGMIIYIIYQYDFLVASAEKVESPVRHSSPRSSFPSGFRLGHSSHFTFFRFLLLKFFCHCHFLFWFFSMVTFPSAGLDFYKSSQVLTFTFFGFQFIVTLTFESFSRWSCSWSSFCSLLAFSCWSFDNLFFIICDYFSCAALDSGA